MFFVFYNTRYIIIVHHREVCVHIPHFLLCVSNESLRFGLSRQQVHFLYIIMFSKIRERPPVYQISKYSGETGTKVFYSSIGRKSVWYDIVFANLISGWFCRHIICQKIYNWFTYQHINVQLASHDFELPSNDIYMTILILHSKYMQYADVWFCTT